MNGPRDRRGTGAGLFVGGAIGAVVVLGWLGGSPPPEAVPDPPVAAAAPTVQGGTVEVAPLGSAPIVVATPKLEPTGARPRSAPGTFGPPTPPRRSVREQAITDMAATILRDPRYAPYLVALRALHLDDPRKEEEVIACLHAKCVQDPPPRTSRAEAASGPRETQRERTERFKGLFPSLMAILGADEAQRLVPAAMNPALDPRMAGLGFQAPPGRR